MENQSTKSVLDINTELQKKGKMIEKNFWGEGDLQSTVWWKIRNILIRAWIIVPHSWDHKGVEETWERQEKWGEILEIDEYDIARRRL